jgi:tRNA dimethylallyltransferase
MAHCSKKAKISQTTASMSTTSQHNSKKPKILVLTGPTAVGKTKVSVALAQALNGEIISADSVQVYKGLDIGSDKITKSEMQGVPHHLLDILDPEEDFSAGDFYTKAREAAADILSRGKVPIVVGGTGFYLRWFIYGKPSTPISTSESELKALKLINQAINQVAVEQKVEEKDGGVSMNATSSPSSSSSLSPIEEEMNWKACCDLVRSLGDPESAERLQSEPNNMYRLKRVVDILLQTRGTPLSQQNLNTTAPLDYDFRCFFLYRPRVELCRRIDERVETIVHTGLLKEAHAMLKSGLLPDTNCATRAIGYKQALLFLKNTTEATERNVLQLVKAVQDSSRALSKKQMNWFRNEAIFRWVDASGRSEDAVVGEVVGVWEKEEHEGGVMSGSSSCSSSNGGRLSEEEKNEMKRYVAVLKQYVAGSEVLRDTTQQADMLIKDLTNR